MQATEIVSLANLGKGAAVERFDDMLTQVLENVMDPNTNPTAKREVTLRVILQPNKDRSFCEVSVSCSGKLAPPINVQTNIFVGRDGKRVLATEHNPQQLNLELHSSAPAPNVTKFPKGEEK